MSFLSFILLVLQVVRAAIFDLLTSQCDRHAQVNAGRIQMKLDYQAVYAHACSYLLTAFFSHKFVSNELKGMVRSRMDALAIPHTHISIINLIFLLAFMHAEPFCR